MNHHCSEISVHTLLGAHGLLDCILAVLACLYFVINFVIVVPLLSVCAGKKTSHYCVKWDSQIFSTVD